MKASQGSGSLKSSEVADEVFSVIAAQLNYGHLGVDCAGVAGWLTEGRCPTGTLEVAGNRMAVLMGLESDCVLGGLSAEGDTVWRLEGGGELRYSVADLLEFWQQRPREEGADFPLSPVVRAFVEQPRVISPDVRETGRVIPAKLAMVHPGDARGLELFSEAAYVSGKGKDQLILPGFERRDTVAPVLPLLLYDMGAGESEGGRTSPGAPLALRLFVESILSVHMADRAGEGPLALQVPLRMMLKWLYPGNRAPRPSEYWPRLIRAAEVLDSREARVPWYDSSSRLGGHRRVVSIGDIPRGPNCLDDEVRIIVDLPPGSEVGPQVSDRLRYYGVRSAVAYRILLHLAYRWHNPGRTLVPVGGQGAKRRQHWVRVFDPVRYDELTDDELVQMAYPVSSTANRRQLLMQAKKWLKVLEEEGELQVKDGKILPPSLSAP